MVAQTLAGAKLSGTKLICIIIRPMKDVRILIKLFTYQSRQYEY